MRKEEFPILRRSIVRRYLSIAEKSAVSVVSRSESGFIHQYLHSRKNPSEEWLIARDGFIRRHMAQFKHNPTYRRYLSFIMWAYDPICRGTKIIKTESKFRDLI